MAFKDNREFIQALDKTNDVVHIKDEVDWDLEVGAIIRRTNERRGQAVFFENIKDYPKGYRIFGAPLATYRRLAIAMGLDPDTSVRTLHEEYDRRMKNPIKPVVVKTGPCKENILLGDDIDLYRLPAPTIHDGDGGRYIGTWHLVINNDPESDWSNWGLYRVVIHDKRHLTGLIVHEINQSGVIFFNKYVPKHKPMPVAIAIGPDPLCVAVAADPIAMNLSEVDYAGGLRQSPVEMVKCETIDLMVPAYSEIVIEGEMLPDVLVQEGPFGEYPGYRTQSMKDRHVMRVTAITHRNDPILTMTNMGVPADEGALIGTVTTAIRLKERLKRKGIPVVDVYLPPDTASHIAYISVAKYHAPDVAVQIREAMIARRSQVPKAIVVDDDVDVFDVGQVIHSFDTKCHPIRGITARAHESAIDLTPFLSPEERFKLHGATAVFDCTWPVDWSVDFDRPLRCSFNEVYPQEIKDKVLKNWGRYGLK